MSANLAGMKKSILLVAHGSRREASNDEIRDLTARLREQAGSRYRHIECAFLELADPTIPDGIQKLIDQGGEHVVVLPYFLAAGNHVIKDIPAEVAVKQQAYPQLKIEIADYLGSADGVAPLLLSLVE